MHQRQFAPPSGTVAQLRAALALCRRAGGRTFVLIAALQAIGGLAVGAQLLAVKAIVDAVTAPDRGWAAMVWLLGLLGCATIASAVAQVHAISRRELLTELVEQQATLEVVDATAGLELAAFDDASTFDLIERTLAQVNLRALQVVNATGALITGLAVGAAVGVTLAAVAPVLLAIVLGAIVPLLVAGSRNNWDYYRLVRDTTATAREKEYFAGVLTRRDAAAELRALDAVPVLQSRYRRASERLIAELAGTLRVTTRRSSLGAAANAVAVLGAGAAAVALYRAGTVDLAGGTVAVLAVVQLRTMLEGVALQVGQLHEAALFLGDLDRLRTPSGVTGRPRAEDPLDSLKLTGVEFCYSGAPEPSLRGINLDIRAGEVVAIVGPNGSGKSTLLKLLAGLYEPVAGTMRWNGAPQRPGPAQVAVLLQEYGRYWMSLRDNVVIGQPEATAKAVRSALDEAHAQAVVAAANDGLDTMLSPQLGGQDLSSGQWQRLALARCLLRPATLVLLDEPTSAADLEAEDAFIAWMAGVPADKGVVVVTHRPRVAQAADRCLTIDGGRLAPNGATVSA